MKRSPVVAGQFYPAEPEQLRQAVKKLVDETAKKEPAIGAVMPHAGYMYSGAVAGAAISRIELKPTAIVLGPNHTGQGYPLSIMSAGAWTTPLGDVEIDSALAGKILAASRYLKEDALAHQYEHSIEVQLPFLQYLKPEIKLVPIVLSFAPEEAYRDIGLELAKAVKELEREVVIIASSDMTHYEPQQSAESKDRQAVDAILDLDAARLMERVRSLDISMCGYAPVIAMLAAAKALGASHAELVRYQTSGDVSGDRASVVGYAGIIVKEMSPLVKLARQTVESYVKEGKVPQVTEPTPEMRERAGVFVSIHKEGELRGCIGTFEPVTGNVAEEVIANAVSSATRDPRFPPVTPGELEDLEYSVDVLTRPEPVEGPEALDCKKYGVIAQCGWRRGLLLPDLEGVDSVDYQIAICRQKAGIHPDEPVKLYRFEVKRYK